MQTILDGIPTGEACAGCGAEQYWAPGYLVARPDGRRFFTTCRITDHDLGCEINEEGDNG